MAAALVALAAGVGYRYAVEHYRCQNCLPDLLYPCFQQFGYEPEPGELAQVPAHQRFWAEGLAGIPCEAVAHLPTRPLGHYWLVQRYMHAALSAVLLITGPTFTGFHLFVAGMYGLTILAAFGLFRLGMGPAVAAAMSVVLIFSGTHLHHMVTPADYAKAPFAVALLWLTGLLLRRPRARRDLFVLAAAAGLTAGVGIGFKPDILVCTAIVLLALLLFLPRPLTTGRGVRIATVGIFLVAFLAAGAPILRTNFFSGLGSLFPVQMLGGMMRAHDDTHAAPSLYDYGINWDDSWVTFQVNSYDQRVLGGEGFHNFLSPELTAAATHLVVAIYETFPADLVLRVVGAVIRVLSLYPLGLAAAALVLVWLYATRLRLALAVTFLLLTFVGYVSLVFQSRHYFHLEVVPLWMGGVVLHHGFALAWRRRSAGRAGALRKWWASKAPASGLAVMALVGVLVVTTLWAARAYQGRRLAEVIASYEQVPTAPFPADRVDDDGRSRLVLRAEDRKALGTPAALRTTYLVADVDCLAAVDAEVLRVYASPDYWQHAIRVPCGGGAAQVRLFIPVYESGEAWRFEAIEWATASPIRVRSLRQVADVRETPLLLTLSLPEDWRQQPLVHRLSWTALSTPQRW